MIISSNNSTIADSSLYIITDHETNEVVLAFDMIEECEFKASTTVVTYPTERGVRATDYKYDNPDVIKLKCFVRKREDNKQQRDKILTQLDYYKSGLYAVDVQTKAGLRSFYTVSSYTIPENLDNYSLLEVDLECQQIIDFSQEQPRDSSDMDTVATGISQTQTAEA